MFYPIYMFPYFHLSSFYCIAHTTMPLSLHTFLLHSAVTYDAPFTYSCCEVPLLTTHIVISTQSPIVEPLCSSMYTWYVVVPSCCVKCRHDVVALSAPLCCSIWCTVSYSWCGTSYWTLCSASVRFSWNISMWDIYLVIWMLICVIRGWVKWKP
jgi:hypothetical protein